MRDHEAEPCARPPAPGVRLVEGGAEIGVVSRHAEKILFCVFDPADREILRIRLMQGDGDLHSGFVPNLSAGMRYGLRADGPWDPRAGHLFDPAKLLVDPYATRLDRAFDYDPAFAAPRHAAKDTAALMPKALIEPAALASRAGDGATRRPEKGADRPAPRLVYEVGVKAHTKLDHGVPLDLRGTLSGLAFPHVIERFVELGVSHVELMPIAAWIDERHLSQLGLTNAWGYNPVCFMALDPRLAPDGMDELRRVADALRAADIGVILDVVFNHTGEGGEHGPTLSLRGLDNALYYRRTAGGHYANDAGCGNTLACDEPIVQRLVLDTLRQYVRDAGVDGFRFDLAPTLGRDARGFSPGAGLLKAIEQDPLLRDRILIAEPWDVGPGGYQLGRFGPSWSEWNDRFRDDVRRFWRGDAHAAGAFATRLTGSSDLFDATRRKPSASVNFVAAHDGFTLRDLVSYSGKRNRANGENNRDGAATEICWTNGVDGETDDTAILARRKADVRALLATLLLARGTPMLTAGDECGRTQRGNNNAYAQDNDTTWLDWTTSDRELARFVGALAGFRRSHPVLTEDRFLTGAAKIDAAQPDATWTRADGRPFDDNDWDSVDIVSLTLAPTLGRSARVHLVFNRSSAPVDLTLPHGVWRLAVDSSRGFVGDESAPGAAPPRSALAFVEAPV
jgi:glycogen debranching enzyme